jgi:hypothetical protein
MATRTNPLVSAAVLASAAAIAVASPAIAPSVLQPTPHALAAAKVQLTTFADLLSITPEDYSTILFSGYGEAISQNQDPDFDWAALYLAPFTKCNFNCKVNGPSGVAYAMLDALINGNGTGYAPVEDADGNYIKGYPTWNVSAVNYFFEGGFGIGSGYLVTSPFGNPKSPLYNPTVAGLLVTALQGLPALTTYYVAGLTAIAKLAQQVPTVGPYVYGAINAYLGPQTSDPKFGNWGYAAGLSGILRYVTDVITTNGNPYPPYGSATPAASVATLAAAAVPAAARTVADAPNVVAAAESAPATGIAKVSAAQASVPESAPAREAKVGTPAVSEAKVVAPVVGEAKVSAPAEVGTPAVSTPAPDLKPVEAPSVPDVKPSTPAGDTTPEAPAPVKDLGKEIAKAEAPSAGAGGSKSDASDSKSGGADAKESTPAATSSATEATSGDADAKGGASDTKAGDTKAGDSASGSAAGADDSAK